jgi:pyridoxine kinase
VNKQKKALAIHDISCVGRCSITVALPVLSAAGINTGVLPTAVLSTHTGGFQGYTYRDLTADIQPIADHFRSLHLEFDALYSGFLGSYKQIGLVKELFLSFRRENNLIVVDPVMGDNGSLYPVYTKEMARGMADLCSVADLIVPNLTEASLMLGETYQEDNHTEDYIQNLVRGLLELGCHQVVLTGVSLEKGMLGAACCDRASGEVCYYHRPKIEGMFHGTGDVFGSGMLAALMNGKSLEEAMRFAVDFTHLCIRYTVENGEETRYGPCFERALPFLIRRLGLLEAENSCLY